MDNIKEILKKLLEKECSIEEAEKLLKANLVEEVGDLAKLDVFRKTRTGIPEVILGQNKEPQIIIDITKRFLKTNKFAIISRYIEKQREFIVETFGNEYKYDIEIIELGKIIVIKEKKLPDYFS